MKMYDVWDSQDGTSDKLTLMAPSPEHAALIWAGMNIEPGDGRENFLIETRRVLTREQVSIHLRCERDMGVEALA